MPQETEFSTVRKEKEKFCKGLVLNTGFRMSLERLQKTAETKNPFESYSASTFKYFIYGDSSSVLGLLVPFIFPILLIISFIASMIIFIIFLFPGFFQTRKENITICKQRTFLVLTIVMIVIVMVSFYFFSVSLGESIENANYSACFFYLIQYDMISGLDEKDYSFVGFDNIYTNMEAFKRELVNFNSISDSLDIIEKKDFNGKKDLPLQSSKYYSDLYKIEKILASDVEGDVQRIPLQINSLTDYINNDIQSEFLEIRNVAENLVSFTNYGKKIISKYKDAPDVLVSSMVDAMNYVVEKFQYIVNEMIEMDGPIEQFISYMDGSLILLVILFIILIIFIPVYGIFYKLKNSSDTNDWTVRMIKGWLVALSILGIIFSFFLFVFVYANLITSSFCFYTDQVLTYPDFYDKHKSDLNITNEDIRVILENCFEKEKSSFSQIFNLNGENTNSTFDENAENIRTKPKKDTTETNPETDPETTPETTPETNPTPSEPINDNIQVTLMAQEAPTTPETTPTTPTDPTTPETTPTYPTTPEETDDTPPSVPDTFNTQLLSDFQNFVKNYYIYQSFYQNNTTPDSPSLTEYLKSLEYYRDGILYNFVAYEQDIKTLNDLISCSGYSIATNIRKCTQMEGCITVKDNSPSQTSAKIATQDCIVDKNNVLEIYTKLKESLYSGEVLGSRMINDVNGTFAQVEWDTPGQTSQSLRNSLMEIESDMLKISLTFKNSFEILGRYGGDLSGLTNCYIARRQVTLLETPVCFMFRPKLYSTFFYIFVINIGLLSMLWTIFFSVKYAGNFGVNSWAEQTTLASAWDKSKQTGVSFFENSEIVNINESKSDITEDISYFTSDSEKN